MTTNQANTRPELLPCPFCGGKAEFVPHPNWKAPWGWIRCIKCGSRSDDVKERDAQESMPEIEFTIDTETGKCDTEIKGVHGPACEKTAQQLKQVLGSPSKDTKTKEYYVRPQQKRRIEAK